MPSHRMTPLEKGILRDYRRDKEEIRRAKEEFRERLYEFVMRHREEWKLRLLEEGGELEAYQKYAILLTVMELFELAETRVDFVRLIVAALKG